LRPCVEDALADLVSLSRQEGVAHATADEQRVSDLEQALDHTQLVGDLGASQHHDEGPLG